MNLRMFGLAILAMFVVHSVTVASTSAVSQEQEWNFRVYLGQSEIGEHRFRLERGDAQSKLVTEADFKVRFLFVTAYRYRHVNTETWGGDCLQAIDAQTNANGRILEVQGMQGPDGFRIDAPESQDPYPGCVKTFAYWNPGILEEAALLNPQTGKLTPVESRLVASETLSVRGREVAARKYELLTDEQSLNIWYSENNEWLALESTTKDGRTLRYELI